jgi:hypothetical protein
LLFIRAGSSPHPQFRISFRTDILMGTNLLWDTRCHRIVELDKVVCDSVSIPEHMLVDAV